MIEAHKEMEANKNSGKVRAYFCGCELDMADATGFLCVPVDRFRDQMILLHLSSGWVVP